MADTKREDTARMGFCIREMTMDDIPAVAEIERTYSQTPWEETGLFTYFVRNDTLFYVAEDEQILGFIGILLIPWESEVLEITVTERARRRGVGTALMQTAMAHLPEKKVTVLYLEVRKSASPARHLYQKLGFREDGIRRGYYTDPDEDAVLMSRKIDETPV